MMLTTAMCEAPAQRLFLLTEMLQNLIHSAPTEDGLPGEEIPLHPRNTFERGYMAAVMHLLSALGVLRIDGELLSAQVVSPQARYLLLLLLDLLRTDTPLVKDWHSEGLFSGALPSHTGRAVDLLAALEQLRLTLDPHAAPLRRTQAAVGLVLRRTPGGELLLLLSLDTSAAQWQLPGGRFERSDNTLRTTLRRELSEELRCERLVEPDDIILHALCKITLPPHLSRTLGMLTTTTFQLFAVQLVREMPPLHDRLRWVPLHEVLAGQTADGGRVATPLPHILEQHAIQLDRLPTL